MRAIVEELKVAGIVAYHFNGDAAALRRPR